MHQDLLDPKEQLEYGGKWALKDHREKKEQLETKEIGDRKDTEGSPGSTVCQEQPVPQATQGRRVSLDQLVRGVLKECPVLQETKETSVSQDRWALLEGEGPAGTSVHRVHLEMRDRLALQAPPALPPRVCRTSSAALTITRGSATPRRS